MFFKRQIPVIIMTTIGMLTLLSNFIIEGKSATLDNVTSWVNDDSLLWFGIIAAFAIILGAFNLLKIHISKILKNNKDYPYSIFNFRIYFNDFRWILLSWRRKIR